MFLVTIPLAWAVLLVFHPVPDPDDVCAALRDVSTRWLVVVLHAPPVGPVGLLCLVAAVVVWAPAGVRPLQPLHPRLRPAEWLSPTADNDG